MKYYTAGQARKALGNIGSNSLKYYVDRGILHKYIPPGKRQGLYSKAEVDALAQAQHEFYQDTEESNDGRTANRA